MSDPSSAGPEHDAWLREALRHAPDASASPPSSLSDAILAEARAAARSGATRRAPASPASTLVDRVLAFWSWLARPPVAAGFASVMAATLVGMLWWDRPMDETMLPPPSSPAVTAPKPAQERSGAAGQRPSPPTDADAAAPPAGGLPEVARSPAPASGLHEAAPAPAAPRAAEAAAKEAERKQQAARATADERARSQAKLAAGSEEAAAARKTDKLGAAPPPAPTTTPATRAAPPPPAPGVARPAAEAPSPFPAPPAEADAPRPAAPAAVPPSPATAPPLSTTPSQQPPAPALGRTEPFALAKKAESGEKEGVADTARSAPTAELRAPAAGPLGGAAQNAARPAARQAAPVVASPRPMAPLLAALTSEEPRWARRLANGESATVDVALRTWLAQVQSAAAARWESAGEPGARRDGPVAASTAILHLERDGGAGATVQIVDGGVLFFDPLSGGAWFAPLPPDVVARLRATVPPAPR